jgi:Extensin-like protein C-terminus
MKGGVRFYIAGAVVLLALAGCGRSFLQYGEERASWRYAAEVSCLKSGAVKVGAGVVQMQPIEGPGMCGADFPFKVAVLGESTAMSYSDEGLRPPSGIPNASGVQPRWPAGEQRYAPPVEVDPMQGQPAQGQMRWAPGPPGIERPESTAPTRYGPANEPPAPAGRPMSIYAPGVAQPDDIPDDAVLPPGRGQPTYPRNAPAYNAPVYQPPPQRVAPTLGPSLGPMRGPAATAAIMPAAVTPAATLACPLVSALDRWVTEGVQPAALRWFGTQVTEIKQISAYSCRGMVGSGSSGISEHAFGNALDIAAFTLADGRKVTVKDGWRGSPEEQGFLHDVQLYACETFSTVLAPGYNAAHYDHIHVDLMRRESGRRPCRPDAIPGEVAAAKARSLYASKQRGPAYTGSVATKVASGKTPVAIPGEDGYVAGEDDDAVTGSISKMPVKSNAAIPGADGEFDDDVTGSITAPKRSVRSRSLGDENIRAEERRSAFH